MSVVSKSGGRDFHGSLFYYLRDYHLNSNEWYGNKVSADRPKNKFNYPGFNISGPLLIPGTNFNKNRDKVFFFAGFQYFGQTLDTGFVRSWVPTAAMRNGDFSQAASLGLTGCRSIPSRTASRAGSSRRDRSTRAVRCCSTSTRCRTPTRP